MAGMASLDSTTARLIAAGVDLPCFLESGGRVRPLDPGGGSPVRAGRSRRRTRRQRASVPPRMLPASTSAPATFGDARLNGLPGHIDNARARLGPQPAYRRRGVYRLVVPRADIEIDVDMENVAGWLLSLGHAAQRARSGGSR